MNKNNNDDNRPNYNSQLWRSYSCVCTCTQLTGGSSRRLNPSRSQCVLPTLPLWTDTLRSLFSAPEPLSCSTLEQNWIYVDNQSLLHISDWVVRRHGSVSCNYTPVHRGRDDFEVMLFTIYRSTLVNLNTMYVSNASISVYKYSKNHRHFQPRSLTFAKNKQEIWANPHETRDSFSLGLILHTCRLSWSISSNFGENSLFKCASKPESRKIY